MLQNHTAIYALIALYEIANQQGDAKHPQCVRVCDIVAKYKLPGPYLARVVTKLVDAEILHSHRGRYGGNRLARTAKDITLYDVLVSVGALGNLGKGSKLVKGLPRPVKVDSLVRTPCSVVA